MTEGVCAVGSWFQWREEDPGVLRDKFNFHVITGV